MKAFLACLLGLMAFLPLSLTAASSMPFDVSIRNMKATPAVAHKGDTVEISADLVIKYRGKTYFEAYPGQPLTLSIAWQGTAGPQNIPTISDAGGKVRIAVEVPQGAAKGLRNCKLSCTPAQNGAEPKFVTIKVLP